ncbi:hypothetical protein [Rhizobium ruizarguesonis]
MTRRNRQSGRTKLRLPLEALTDLAPSIIPDHGRMVGDGYDLQASSAIHRTRAGTLTARLVYRPRSDGDAVQSFVITVRNIVLDSDTLSEQKTMRKR